MLEKTPVLLEENSLAGKITNVSKQDYSEPRNSPLPYIELLPLQSSEENSTGIY